MTSLSNGTNARPDSQRALITGVSGQDGTYLAEQLTRLGYKVWGTTHTHSIPDAQLSRIRDIQVIPTDLSDPENCRRIVAEVEPDLLFHFAAISSVGYSWDKPVETATVNGISTVALLEATLNLQERSGKQRTIVNASSAEIFAGSAGAPQNEDSPVRPLSPYGASKALAHHMVQVFRSRGLRASNAIFYNHESPLRPTRFVTRKITASVAAISKGRQAKLSLGNLDAKRDWGWAPDYVDCALRIATHDVADDFVVATGEAHSVSDFVQTAFEAAGIADWRRHVETDSQLYRPADSIALVGDASKAREQLGWTPTMSFADVVGAMVEHDLALQGIDPLDSENVKR